MHVLGALRAGATGRMMRVCAARLTSQAAAHASRHHGTHNLALTFSGSGMMMVWQMGVASALRCDERFMARVARVLGTSGGACVGAMLLASPPGAFEAAVRHYTSGALLREVRAPRDLFAPHDELLSRTVASLGALPAGSGARLRGRFAAHVTPCEWPPRNVALSDFADDGELLRAISASCCLLPTEPVAWGGARYFDGGLSDPMPADDELPTVTVSILAGAGVDVAPSEAPPLSSRRELPQWRRDHVFLRYDASAANARALVDAAFMGAARAQWRFEQGSSDGRAFLRSIGHDPPPRPQAPQAVTI